MKKIVFQILILVNIVLYLTTVATWLALPQHYTINIAGSFSAILLSLILLGTKVRDIFIYLKSVQAKVRMRAFTNIFLVFCCLGMVNFLAYKNPLFFDFSSSHLTTLSTQGQKALKSLGPEVKITLIERPSDRARWKPLLEIYRLVSPENFKYSLVDPDLRPDLVRELPSQVSSALVFEKGNMKSFALRPEEAQITEAILKILRPKIPVVGMLQGHGEKDPFGVGETALSALKQNLEERAYKVQTLDIAATGEVPREIDLLMLWGPTSALFDSEIKGINAYLNKGGKLLVALDPQFGQDPHVHLRKWLEEKGIKVSNDLVVDQIAHVAGAPASVPIIKSFNKDHVATKDLKAQVFFPLTASVEKSSQAKQEVLILAQSHSFPAAWAEKNLSEVQKGVMNFHPELDKKGPIGVLAITELDLGSKLGVFGNSSFITDKYQNYGGNRTLFLNVLEWMIGEEKFIADGPVQERWEPLLLGETEIGLIFYLSVIFIPLIMGILAFWRFRRSYQG